MTAAPGSTELHQHGPDGGADVDGGEEEEGPV